MFASFSLASCIRSTPGTTRPARDRMVVRCLEHADADVEFAAGLNCAVQLYEAVLHAGGVCRTLASGESEKFLLWRADSQLLAATLEAERRVVTHQKVVCVTFPPSEGRLRVAFLKYIKHQCRSGGALRYRCTEQTGLGVYRVIFELI